MISFTVTTSRRQFLVGALALGSVIAVGAAGVGAAEAATLTKPVAKRNYIENGSFEEGPLGVPRIDDWVVVTAVVPV